jgi:hypothetical protein
VPDICGVIAHGNGVVLFLLFIPSLLSDNFVEEAFASDLDVISCLYNIDTIKFLEAGRIMERYGKSFTYLLNDLFHDGHVFTGEGKVMNLT